MFAPSTPWLTDLCRVSRLLVVLAAAQLVVIVVALAPAEGPRWGLGSFAAISGLAQWIALTAAISLCKLRSKLLALPLWLGIITAWAVPVLIAACSLWLVAQVDLGAGSPLAPARAPVAILSGNAAAITGLIAALVLRYFYLQDHWQAQVSAIAKSEFEALQARIRPHFLFNSMNTIASLIRRDPDTAERVVEDLSDLFRAALGGGQGESTLGDELDLTRRYLDIEGLRLGERLRVRFAIADDVPMTLPMPRLILQPLAENAIVHGVSRLDGGGEVLLQAWRDGDAVRLRVSNPAPPEPGPASNGHALASIAQRLAYRFGPAAQLLGRRDGEHYRCELRIPAP